MKLKIICLNVWIGGILMDEILQFLSKEKPDILLLQEAYSDADKNLEPKYRTVEFLQEKLGFKYSHFAPAFIEDVNGREILQGNAVLSNYEIDTSTLGEKAVQYYDVPLSKRIDEYAYYEVTPRSLEHVVIKVPVDKSESWLKKFSNIFGNNSQFVDLHVFNTQGIWGEHGKDTDRRIKMAEKIVEELGNLPETDKVILAGDFNVEPDTKTIAMIEDKMKSVFKDELVTSFNLKHKDLVKSPGYAKSVVDMFFVSSAVKVLSHKCANDDVSDHLSLVVEVEIL